MNVLATKEDVTFRLVPPGEPPVVPLRFHLGYSCTSL